MMAKALKDNEVTEALKVLPSWKHDDNCLCREHKTKDFTSAIALLVKVGFAAEQLKHHPTISNTYNKLSFRLTTHDADNKVTAKDIELARQIDTIIAES